MELLPLKLSRFRYLDHNTRVDLVNERDASSPNPVHGRNLPLNIHNEIRAGWEVTLREQEWKQVFGSEQRGNKGVEGKRRQGRGRLC